MNVNGIGIATLNSCCARRAHALILGTVAAMSFFSSASLCQAQSELVRLVPPAAPVIAGLHRVPNNLAKDSLWLATRNNGDDLTRLLALTDHDPDRRIEQVMVADWASSNDRLGNHLLIAQGQFSLANVFTAATARVLEKTNYDGVPVLAIDAEGGAKPATRWLAMPKHQIALFGTPAAVQIALDRFRNGSPADPQLLQRLRDAHPRDAAWSSVLLDSSSGLRPLDLRTADAFSACVARLRGVGLGIQLGGTVTIDLHMEPRDASGRASGGTMQCVSEALFGRNTPQMRVAFDGDRQPHVRVTMARAQYDAWLDSFRTSRTRQLLEAMISGSDPVSDSSAETAVSLR